MKGIVAVVLALALAGCATPRPATTYSAFIPEQYSVLPTSGTGTLTGQVFMRTQGGDVKVGAGSQVLLLQQTGYSRQFYHAYLRGERYPGMDPRAISAGRHTLANASGEFTFTDVPPGAYYVVSQVTWGAPTRYGLSQQGGEIIGGADVANDSTTTIMLTR